MSNKELILDFIKTVPCARIKLITLTIDSLRVRWADYIDIFKDTYKIPDMGTKEAKKIIELLKTRTLVEPTLAKFINVTFPDYGYRSCKLLNKLNDEESSVVLRKIIEETYSGFNEFGTFIKEVEEYINANQNYLKKEIFRDDVIKESLWFDNTKLYLKECLYYYQDKGYLKDLSITQFNKNARNI